MVSICMAYYARQPELDRGLASLRACYGDAVEVVVADDGSPIPVDAPGCRIVRLPGKGHALNPCVPLNAAVAMSRGDVIVLTNPEIEHRDAILGPLVAGLGPVDYAIAACRDAVSGVWLCASHVRGGSDGRGPIPPGSGFHFCAALRRSLWERAGRFDEAYRDGQGWEDNDFLFRLARAGARFVMRDDLVVYHHRTRTVWPAGGHERNRQRFRARWPHAA